MIKTAGSEDAACEDDRAGESCVCMWAMGSVCVLPVLPISSMELWGVEVGFGCEDCHCHGMAVRVCAGWSEVGHSILCVRGAVLQTHRGSEGLGAVQVCTCLRGFPCPLLCALHTHVFQHDPACSRVCISLLGSILSHALCPFAFLSSPLLL